MSKIKIAELFYSIQGEGRYMGVPSVFLRTFGCNFKCAGFGMPKGELSTEIEPIAARIGEFTKYEQLPLASTGCIVTLLGILALRILVQCSLSTPSQEERL